MRVHVQGLPLNQDFSTQFQIPKSAFLDENPEHQEPEPIFLTPVDCKVTLRKMSVAEILMTFSASALIEPICDRCTEPYQLPFTVESSLLCKPLTQNPTEMEEEDEGLIFFTKQELNLDQIIREQIFLALPMQYICDENCQGLCPGCGDNLNDGDHECKRAKFIEHKAKVL